MVAGHASVQTPLIKAHHAVRFLPLPFTNTNWRTVSPHRLQVLFLSIPYGPPNPIQARLLLPDGHW